MGFTLNEMKQLLDAAANGAMATAEAIQVTEGKLAEIDENMRQLAAMRTLLLGKLQRLQRLA